MTTPKNQSDQDRLWGFDRDVHEKSNKAHVPGHSLIQFLLRSKYLSDQSSTVQINP